MFLRDKEVGIPVTLIEIAGDEHPENDVSSRHNVELDDIVVSRIDGLPVVRVISINFVFNT